MKKCIIKILFQKGQVGYFKNEECITSDKDKAMICNKSYAMGLCRGINFAIRLYEDKEVIKAYVEEIK